MTRSCSCGVFLAAAAAPERMPVRAENATDPAELMTQQRKLPRGVVEAGADSVPGTLSTLEGAQRLVLACRR